MGERAREGGMGRGRDRYRTRCHSGKVRGESREGRGRATIPLRRADLLSKRFESSLKRTTHRGRSPPCGHEYLRLRMPINAAPRISFVGSLELFPFNRPQLGMVWDLKALPFPSNRTSKPPLRDVNIDPGNLCARVVYLLDSRGGLVLRCRRAAVRWCAGESSLCGGLGR